MDGWMHGWIDLGPGEPHDGLSFVLHV